MLRVIPVHFERHLAFAHALLDFRRAIGREEVVVFREVALHRNFNRRRIAGFGRRKTVEHHRSIDFFDVHRGDERNRAAHAVSGHAGLRPVLFEVLERTADVLQSGVSEIETFHQMVCFIANRGRTPAKQIRD